MGRNRAVRSVAHPGPSNAVISTTAAMYVSATRLTLTLSRCVVLAMARYTASWNPILLGAAWVALRPPT